MFPSLGPEGWLGPEPGPRLGAPLCELHLHSCNLYYLRAVEYYQCAAFHM